MNYKFIFLFFNLIICATSNLSGQDTLHTKPVTPSANNRILIINSFDAQALEARKNKKALFGELAESLKQMLKSEISQHISGEIEIVRDFISNSSGNDSIYFELIKKHSATIAIVIKSLNAYFEQTGVEVTKEPDGKKRVASYDIHADVIYHLYNETSLIKKSDIKVWEYFTDRTVISGLLAAGPDIVGKRKHAFKITGKNAEQYISEIRFLLKND